MTSYFKPITINFDLKGRVGSGETSSSGKLEFKRSEARRKIFRYRGSHSWMERPATPGIYGERSITPDRKVAVSSGSKHLEQYFGIHPAITGH